MDADDTVLDDSSTYGFLVRLKHDTQVIQTAVLRDVTSGCVVTPVDEAGVFERAMVRFVEPMILCGRPPLTIRRRARRWHAKGHGEFGRLNLRVPVSINYVGGKMIEVNTTLFKLDRVVATPQRSNCWKRRMCRSGR